MKDYGQIVIKNKEKLLSEIKTMLPFTSIHLLGPSGSGKTSLVESLMNVKELKIDEIKIIRLQGVSSEDFRMPIVKTIKKEKEEGPFGEKQIVEEKVVDLVKMGVFQEIIDNPNRQYLVFFDELLRANAEIAPLLFGLLERRIDGIPVNNVYVLAASNYGDSYISNIDLSDSALRRRQIFIEYQPSKEDIVDFAEENNYNDILQEVIQSMSISELISHEKTTKELEQDTQLGSWSMLNNRWNVKKINDYQKAREDVASFGNYMLSNITKNIVMDKLSVLQEVSELDIHNEIIIKKGLEKDKEILYKNGKVFDKNGKETEIKIRTKKYILDKIFYQEQESDYIIKYFNDIIQVFQKDMVLLISLFKDINNKRKKLEKNKDKNFIKIEKIYDGVVELIAVGSKDKKNPLMPILEKIINNVKLEA